MFSLETARLRLEVDAESHVLRLIDRARSCAWTAPLDPAATIRQTDTAILIDLPSLHYRWSLADDHAVVSLTTAGAIDRASAPLSPVFRPIAGNDAPDAIIPQYQGALLRPGTPSQSWSSQAVRGGHTNLSLGMLALTCTPGSLLLVPDRLVGWIARFGLDAGTPFVAYDATPLEAEGWRETILRIFPCDPGVAAVAARYRRLMQDRGQWTPWDEKIDAKPALARLFGSLLAFIGYVHDDTTDYVGNTRKLRAMGFDSILAYPARFAHYTPFTMAGGHPPISLTDAQISAMQEAGARVAPWAWTFEGLDDGSDVMRSIFRHHAAGPAKGWAMDGQQWVQVCPPYQARHIAHRLATDMGAMDWLHFDVNATYPASACWNPSHALHSAPGHPLTLDESIAETRRLLSAATVGNRIVSSEGFNDAYTGTYDLGSTKMVPLDSPSPAAVPVPLTMLVYHDCCIHDWWELHNYNGNPCWNLSSAHTGTTPLGRAGSGEPHLKAALDALYGLPPNVFPFGMQYGWTDRPGGQTYPFRMDMNEPGVQEALQAALPVARLHRRIGRLAMTGFEFVGHPLLQRTTFADGTQVTANLGRDPIDSIPGHSWSVTHLNAFGPRGGSGHGLGRGGGEQSKSAT